MRVFITGASGYIGHAVARAFRDKGHTVYGLVRTKENADLLSLDEIWPIIGEMEKPETYAPILNDVEVVVHCAFENSAHGIEREKTFIDHVLNKFSRGNLSHTFIYTSGIWVYGSTGHRVVDESNALNPIDLVKWRPEHEQKVLKSTSPILKTVVIRPGIVYGGVGGLTNLFFTSIQNGSVRLIGEGHNHWAMIHVRDLAAAYVAAAEKEISNVIFNVVDDASPTMQEIVNAIANSAGISRQVRSISEKEAEELFGPVTQGLLIDQQVNNARVKRLLGWHIHHSSFIKDVDIYYHAWKTAQSISVS